MEPGTRSPEVDLTASIPIAYYIAASKDKELRRLLRAKGRATQRVRESLEAEEQADQAILDYVQNTYPAPQAAEVA